MKISFSWDDGCPTDYKLVELFQKYSIPTRLFVPNYNREGRSVLTPKDIQSISNNIIKFGGHTYNHTYLTELPLNQALEEVLKNKYYLEDLLGEQVTHFCFPGGKYTEQLKEKLRSHFETVRTADTMSSAFRGYLRKPTFHFYPRGKKSLLLNSIRQRDKILLDLLKNLNIDDYFSLISEMIKKMADYDDTYQIHIWGHSWELEELQLWNELDKLLCMIKDNYSNSIEEY